ncbi:MAG TPA: AAA family ATPase [Steroidobacteraceae bacterium]|jgi:hypothetical protein|nr:AAA family ATPase [Steroidobacteraceae bacterium]
MSRFQVRTAAQICADITDDEFAKRLETGAPLDAEMVAAVEHESMLGEIADIKNCDLEDVATWERGIMEEARLYAENLISASIQRREAALPDLETARRLRIVEAVDFAGGYDDTEQSWLVDNLLPARGIGMIWGASGTHKTGVALDMLSCVHAGSSWRGKAVTRGRGVLVLAEGQHFFKNRLRAYSKFHNVAMASMPAVVLSPVNLRDNKHVAIFSHELQKLGAAQVWFDTLQQNSAGADGNSDRDMGEVIANLKWLSDKIGCFAGVIHHESKSGHDRGPRGSSVWRPALDMELYVECPDKVNGTIHTEKVKDGPSEGVYSFKREIVGLDKYENGRLVTSVVVTHTDAAPIGSRARKLPKEGTLSRTALDAVKALIATNGGPVYTIDAQKKIAEDKTEPEAGKKDRRIGRAGDEIDALVRQGFLFRVDGKLSDTQVIRGVDAAAF